MKLATEYCDLFGKIEATDSTTLVNILPSISAYNKYIKDTINFLPTILPQPVIMERGGLENISDSSGLCLQDLVGGNGSNNNDHMHNHNHHSMHDGVSAAVSVSSAITGLMSGQGGSGGLGHLHHSAHDISNHHHHHHSVVPHTPTLHEPLEKLKCK